jgi:hypothetical protein
MPTPTRTLVAVAPHGPDARTHVLYFSDGVVVGYEPEHGRVLWEHRLAPEFRSEPPARPTPDSGVPAAVAAPERRGPAPGEAPVGRGRRVVDALPQSAEPG